MKRKIIIFTDKNSYMVLSKAECALKLHISVRTINRHLLSGKPTREGYFFDEIIEDNGYKEDENRN
ncbi:MAG: hypothetical protein II956_16065 [Bacteroidales bacterium]|nr:hypothetical protein [Bacteroidales bacterium]